MGAMKRLAGVGSKTSGKSFFEVQYFFDKPAILSAVDRAARQVLSKFGAFVRRTARQSIRPPRKLRRDEMTPEQLASGETYYASAEPGQPPRNQTGKLRDNIVFWYDLQERSVSIAPAAFRSDDIPGVLEHGGMTRSRGRRFMIRAHPYMGPALEKELPKLPDMWKNAVKGT